MIFNITQNDMRKMAVDWIDPMDNIIELGCAAGNFASLLYDLNIKNYIGIDIKKQAIDSAKKKLPNMHFICCDIMTNLYMLGGSTTFVSFQCLEHIQDDLKVLNAINKGTNMIISIPNSPYKGHLRWFELDGWTKRFSPYIKFEERHIIQNPKKNNKRSFLLKGVRNDYKNRTYSNC